MITSHSDGWHCFVKVAAGCQKLFNAAVGGAALLSVLLSTAAPPAADADPFFSNSKPPLQKMKVDSMHYMCLCTLMCSVVVPYVLL